MSKWFNTSAFGPAPRTAAIRLPGIINAGFSANKQVRFAESRHFEFQAEAFNLMNHYNPDPAAVNRNIRSATFGAIGGGVQGITTRVIQPGAKLV